MKSHVICRVVLCLRVAAYMQQARVDAANSSSQTGGNTHLFPSVFIFIDTRHHCDEWTFCMRISCWGVKILPFL